MISGLARHRLTHIAILLLAALLIRCGTFGDPNLHGDESFYRTVGIAMHHGALPYVDVWDRKPFGLFLLYYLIAGISSDPLAYQIAAAVFASATAWCIALLARRWSSPQGGLLAGIAYLLWLAPLQGYGGQSPVFYNLFIALAALLVIRALPALRHRHIPWIVPLAMLIAGIGITIKTTAFFEAAFLGLCCVAAYWQSAVGNRYLLAATTRWAILGATPALIVATAYWAMGHWDEYWHAMFASNISKVPDWPTSWMRLRILTLALVPLLLLAGIGLMRLKSGGRRFVLFWLLAALAGLCAIPNFYLHYGLPLLVPLCIAAGGFLARGIAGWGTIVALAILSFSIDPPFRFDHAQQSRRAMTDLTQTVRNHIGDGPLLTYDGPSQLYTLTGRGFITPLVFPTHLSHLIEKDVSHLSTLGETRRALAERPGAVVMAVPIRNGPVNEETHQLVLAYAGKHCRLIKVVPTPEWQRTDMIAVWGNCRQKAAAQNLSANKLSGAYHLPLRP